MWDEALECPHLNPLPEGQYVFSVALIYPIFPISLTPGFSEVHGRVYYPQASVDSKPNIERPTPNAQRRTQRLRLAIKR